MNFQGESWKMFHIRKKTNKQKKKIQKGIKMKSFPGMASIVLVQLELKNMIIFCLKVFSELKPENAGEESRSV